jgi:hypothetical protein
VNREYIKEEQFSVQYCDCHVLGKNNWYPELLTGEYLRALVRDRWLITLLRLTLLVEAELVRKVMFDFDRLPIAGDAAISRPLGVCITRGSVPFPLHLASVALMVLATCGIIALGGSLIYQITTDHMGCSPPDPGCFYWRALRSARRAGSSPSTSCCCPAC